SVGLLVLEAAGGGGEQAAVGRECDRGDAVAVLEGLAGGLAGARVPEPDGLVLAPAGEQLAVRREGERADAAPMACEIARRRRVRPGDGGQSEGGRQGQEGGRGS